MIVQFRAAPETLDDELAIILTNSFLPLWNHNWFQSISSPLPRLPQRVSLDAPAPVLDLSPQQQARLSFYNFLIKLTRGIGGDVSIATVPSPADASSELIAAVLLFCPPYKRSATTIGPSLLRDLHVLYKAGIFRVIRGYGIGGFQRVTDVFEENVHRMFNEALTPMRLKSEECGFVQMIAMNTDPTLDEVLKGKGFARQLLQWRSERHWEDCKSGVAGTNGKMTPVILDTTTEQGVQAYERIGFELAGKHVLDTGTDVDGYRLRKDLSKEERQRAVEDAKKITIMRVMLKKASAVSSQ